MALQTIARQWIDMYGVNTMHRTIVKTAVEAAPDGVSMLQLSADSTAHLMQPDMTAGAMSVLQLSADSTAQAVQPGMITDMLTVAVTDTSTVMVDSLTVAIADTSNVITDILTVTADKMFGVASYIPKFESGQDLFDLAGSFLTDSLVFKLIVLLCFVGYCVTLYLYRQQASVLVSVFRSKLYVDNLLGERNYTFDNFLNLVVALGIITLSLAGVKAADILVGANMVAALPPWAVLLLAPVAWVLLGLISLYQTMVLKIAGGLTDGQKFVSSLLYLRKMNFSVGAVLLTPFFLMSSMALESDAESISAIILAVLVIIVIFHLARTYMLFVDEKISKLYWFLYLCGVEIFPVTFLLLSVRKFLV